MEEANLDQKKQIQQLFRAHTKELIHQNHLVHKENDLLIEVNHRLCQIIESQEAEMIPLENGPVTNFPSDSELRFLWKQQSDNEIAGLKGGLRKQRETICDLERDREALKQNIVNLTTYTQINDRDTKRYQEHFIKGQQQIADLKDKIERIYAEYEYQLEQKEQKHREELLEEINLKKKMHSDFMLEILVKDKLISKLESKVQTLENTIAKLLKMVKYPRLVKLLQELTLSKAKDAGYLDQVISEQQSEMGDNSKLTLKKLTTYKRTRSFVQQQSDKKNDVLLSLTNDPYDSKIREYKTNSFNPDEPYRFESPSQIKKSGSRNKWDRRIKSLTNFGMIHPVRLKTQ